MATSTFGYEGYEEARAIARRRRTRILLPIAVVGVMLAALIGIAFHDYRAMREDALALSKGVIVNLQSRIETEVDTFLRPVRGITRLTRDLIENESASGIPVQLAEALGVGMLTNAPQLTALFVGDRSGEFLMVRHYRKGDLNGLETKHIRYSAADPEQREINWTRRASSGDVIATETAPWDEYDPRQRPWYQGAERDRELFWTDVYPFFTGATAGVTAAVPVMDAGNEVQAVVGADVTLESISRFLATLSIGKTGVALIVDDDGRLIAHPEAKLVRENTEGRIELTQLSDLKDPILDRAFDRFRVEGHGRRDFELDDRRYISSVSSLNHLLERDWSVLVVVPEDDFVGFVVDNVRQTLAMGLGVIALAAVLAGVLIRQGLRTDRDATRILERQQQLDAQGEAFGQLATWQCAADDSGASALAPVTESLTRAARVRRASIWQFTADRATLRCIECFDRDSEGHTQGARLTRAEHPDLFDALDNPDALAVVDAAQDQHTASLHHHYLAPLGCRALLAAPIMTMEGVTGTLWLEDGGTRTEWPGHTLSFVRAVANLLALRNNETTSDIVSIGSTLPTDTRLTAPCDPQLGRHFKQSGTDTSLMAGRAANFGARLAACADGSAEPPTQMIEQLAIMTLRLTDPVALAQPTAGDGNTSTAAHLLQELQHTASTNGIGYLKVFNDQIVAAADPSTATGQSLETLIEFGLDAKQICERLLADSASPLGFRIGIDCGPVIGSLVDKAGETFTLWGEAVQMAATMADTALPGTIQVTESVYDGLKDQYLFQLRGHHYLEGSGEFETYLLGGRL